MRKNTKRLSKKETRNGAIRVDMSKILKWIRQDVYKESKASLEADGLEWK
jgi:hypothetical protein